MENQKLEACYSEHSNTIFSEMLGEDEDYQRLKKPCRALSVKKRGSNTLLWMRSATNWNAPDIRRCIWLVLPITKNYPNDLDAADVRHFLFVGGGGTGSNTVDSHAEEQRQVHRDLSA